MEKRRKVGSKWYEKIPQKNWQNNMIPNLSRPSSRLSKFGGIQEPDWVSLGASRSISRSSGYLDSPNASFSLRKRRQSTANIEDILSKHHVARPRSVSLVKYDPLPAINSELSKSQQSYLGLKFSSTSEESDSTSIEEQYFENQRQRHSGNSSVISPIEEHETEHIDEDSEKDVSISDEECPPPLIRSRTYDVIETSLHNLPVIDDSSSGSDLRDSSIEEDSDSYLEIRPKIEVKVNVDGLSLNSFLNQSDDNHSGHLSLTTHPGSPLRNGASSPDLLSKMNIDDYDFDNNNSSSINGLMYDPFENKISVKFLDNNTIHMNFNLDITLKEFLSSLQELEWEEKRLRVVEDVDDKLLDEPLCNLHFNSSTIVYIIPNS